MLGFVPQPNLPKLLLCRNYQRAAETQRERCISLECRFAKNIIVQQLAQLNLSISDRRKEYEQYEKNYGGGGLL